MLIVTIVTSTFQLRNRKFWDPKILPSCTYELIVFRTSLSVGYICFLVPWKKSVLSPRFYWGEFFEPGKGGSWIPSWSRKSLIYSNSWIPKIAIEPFTTHHFLGVHSLKFQGATIYSFHIQVIYNLYKSCASVCYGEMSLTAKPHVLIWRHNGNASKWEKG